MAVDERAGRLLELKDALKAYFEVTGMVAGSGWDAAFRTVRKNDEMAESFVSDLRRLLGFIESEFDARGSAPKRAPTGTQGRGPRVAAREEAPVPLPSSVPTPAPRAAPPPPAAALAPAALAPAGKPALPRVPPPPPQRAAPAATVERASPAAPSLERDAPVARPPVTPLRAPVLPAARTAPARPAPAPPRPTRPAPAAAAARPSRRFAPPNFDEDDGQTHVGAPPQFEDPTSRTVPPDTKRRR